MTPRVSLSRLAREQAGYSAREIARKMCVAESTLLRWEREGWRALWLAEWAVRLYRARGVVCRVDDFHGGVGRRVKQVKK
jgi:transcriptional regulator with XRE-family HTH domain